jgi:autotransporter passenger strand-loop-strand repeat protein
MGVLSGGLVFSTTILGSGTETISAGGTDSGAQISGGEQDVFGVASGATVFSGGFEVVSSGGTASTTVVSNGGTLELLSGGTATRVVIHPGGSLVLGSGMAGVTGLRIVDVIPFTDSSETADNSEPSVAVDPLNTNEIVAGAFGVFSGGTAVNPYFTSIDGGTTWRPYGALDHNDKTLAWSQDGSTLFTATMLELGGDTSDIKTYSGTIAAAISARPSTLTIRETISTSPGSAPAQAATSMSPTTISR